MITGEQLRQDSIIVPSVNYRKITALNCSMIKLFDSDPVKFFEQFKMGKRRKEEAKKTSLIIGDIVDFYLLDCKGSEEIFNNRFEEKFALFDGVKGSGQVFTLADELFKISMDDLDESGRIATELDFRFAEALRRVQLLGKYKGASVDKARKDFDENGVDYFMSLVDNIGKTVVDVSLLDKSKKIVEQLISDSFTKHLFEDDMEFLPKFPIEWRYKMGMKSFPCKSEVDFIQIDHKHKFIYPRDLKTTYDNEEFDFTYIKFQYYLQAAFYHLAVSYWAKENGLEDYKVEPMTFVVADTSSNGRRPIIYRLTQDDLNRGLNGFSLQGRKYRGVHELMEEINWAEDNNIWNASKKVIQNNGIMKLGLRYDT